MPLKLVLQPKIQTHAKGFLLKTIIFRTLVVAAAGMLSLATWPALANQIGDFAEYTILLQDSQSRRTVEGAMSLRLAEKKEVEGLFLFERKTRMPGADEVTDTLVLPSTEPSTFSPEKIEEILLSCSKTEGRKLETIAVPAGVFEVCTIQFAYTQDRVAYQSQVSIGRVPMGQVRFEEEASVWSIPKLVLELKSFSTK